MAGEWPTDVEQAFLALLDAGELDGAFVQREDHEPRELEGVPAVTLFPIAAPDEDRETGPRSQVTWTWRVNLYCDLQQQGYKGGQDQLKALWPQTLRVVRSDPSLGIDGVWATLRDPGGEPELSHGERLIVKSLRLEVRRNES